MSRNIENKKSFFFSGVTKFCNRPEGIQNEFKIDSELFTKIKILQSNSEYRPGIVPRYAESVFGLGPALSNAPAAFASTRSCRESHALPLPPVAILVHRVSWART